MVMSTGIGADPQAPVQIGRWHGENQRQLQESGIAWTFVQPSFFMQNMRASGRPTTGPELFSSVATLILPSFGASPFFSSSVLGSAGDEFYPVDRNSNISYSFAVVHVVYCLSVGSPSCHQRLGDFSRLFGEGCIQRFRLVRGCCLVRSGSAVFSQWTFSLLLF